MSNGFYKHSIARRRLTPEDKRAVAQNKLILGAAAVLGALALLANKKPEPALVAFALGGLGVSIIRNHMAAAFQPLKHKSKVNAKLIHLSQTINLFLQAFIRDNLLGF